MGQSPQLCHRIIFLSSLSTYEEPSILTVCVTCSEIEHTRLLGVRRRSRTASIVEPVRDKCFRFFHDLLSNTSRPCHPDHSRVTHVERQSTTTGTRQPMIKLSIASSAVAPLASQGDCPHQAATRTLLTGHAVATSLTLPNAARSSPTHLAVSVLTYSPRAVLLPSFLTSSVRAAAASDGSAFAEHTVLNRRNTYAGTTTGRHHSACGQKVSQGKAYPYICLT